MLRYMFCPIIGSGTQPDEYRVSVSDLATINVSQSIPIHTSGPDISKPFWRFAMCMVATPSIPPIAGVSNAFVFPEYPLDAQLAGMDTDARAGMVQSLEAYDLDGNGTHLTVPNDDADSFRDLLESVCQQLDPGFGVNGFSVREIAE